ncbi:RNA polymerase sigma-70 factor (sigma-E family) [Streptomyces sp. TLI_55]|uniref:SigE family RNA polymerase sigma factor n=1 Tax=Streptomyces sp. TLI_55 TaxID=1938861 RepID=UPI000BCDD975|nr:SigE family RNA polymerase sigma factor [Streptomyces sp. TLI_55]SNX65881.1 RNA polymerase sigma-70 factor (sigma-E family) [Streptomyces sp. TLI_55]
MDQEQGDDAGGGRDTELPRDELPDFETYAALRWPRLLRTAYLLTNGDHHEAEDLVQVTLAKIYLRWSHIRTLDAPDQYVRRALINNNTTRQRKRRVVQLLTPHLPEQRSPAGDADRPDSYDTRSELFAALATLPPRQRAIVVLRYWECLSEQQTAHLLGCSVGTVKSQASRALKKLRSSAALSEYAATMTHGE